VLAPFVAVGNHRATEPPAEAICIITPQPPAPFTGCCQSASQRGSSEQPTRRRTSRRDHVLAPRRRCAQSDRQATAVVCDRPPRNNAGHITASIFAGWQSNPLSSRTNKTSKRAKKIWIAHACFTNLAVVRTRHGSCLPFLIRVSMAFLCVCVHSHQALHCTSRWITPCEQSRIDILRPCLFQLHP
jgi:hypothetical protein